MDGTTDTVVLVVSVEEAKRNFGKVRREVIRGATVRVDDLRTGETVAWLSAEPPPSVAALSGFLPAPGEASDALWAGE